MTDLCQTVDDLRDLLPELRLDLGDVDGGVLDDVVNQSTGDGNGVELEIRENLRDLHAVGHEVLARQALLPKVGGFAEAIGAGEQFLVEPLRERLAVVVPAGNDRLRLDR